jgi:hypothetical protein
MAASWVPSSIIMWWSLTMRAPGLRVCVLSHISGSRLHHWLPTSQKVPMLSCWRDGVLSLYPTTGSAFPMVWSSVACSAVRCIRVPGGYEACLGEVRRIRNARTSQNSVKRKSYFGEYPY